MSGSFTRKHLNKNYEIIGVFGGSTSYLNDLNKSAAEEGMCYYDTTLNQLRTYDGSSWSAAGINSQSAGSLDAAANIGVKITLDGTIGSGIELEATNAAIASNGQLLLLDNDDAGSDVHSLEITHESTAAAIEITQGTSTTTDIQNSASTWNITGDGWATLKRVNLGDAELIRLGASQDVTMSFEDSVAVGTASGGLLIEAAGADECIQIGSGSSYNFDVWISGNTSTNNYVYWDMDGGGDSVGALIFNNADLDMGDGDLIRLGDSQDFTLAHQASTVQHLCLLGDDGQFNIGADGAGMDMYWHTETASDWIYFDEDNAVVDFVGVDINLSDSAFLYIGQGDDWKIGAGAVGSGSAFAMLPQTAGDTATFTVGDSAGTKVSDLAWYTTTAGAGLFIDASLDKVYLDKADFVLGDDDYILLGDAATAGGTTDGTIRWDNTNSVLEVIGNTLFEDNLTVDGNLTVSGTFAVTGTWDPDNIAMSDDEYISFGSGPDFKILHIASTINVLQISASADNDVIRFGNGLVDGDIIYAENADTSGANFWWDGSGEELFFGKSHDGVNCTWYSETAGDLVQWNQSGASGSGAWLYTGAQIIMEDTTFLKFGTGGTSCAGDWYIYSNSGGNIAVQEVSEAGKAWEFGLSGVGCDVKMFGTTDTYDCTWDQGNDALFFADGAEIGVGGSAGTHDLTISSDGTSTAMVMLTGLHIAGESKKIYFGVSGSNGTDVGFITAAASGTGDITFDASATTFTFTDPMQVVFAGSDVNYTLNHQAGAQPLLIGGTDNSGAQIVFGVSGTNGVNVEFRTAAASGTGGVIFDAGATTVTFTDPQQLVFAGSDVNYTVNHQAGAQPLWFAGADNSGANIVLGVSGTNGTDVTLQTAAASGHNITFDAGASQFAMNNVDLLMLSATSSPTYTAGIDAVASGALRVYGSDTGTAKVWFGISGTNGVDVLFQTAAASSTGDITFDAAATTFTLQDPMQMVFAGSDVNYTINHTSASEVLAIAATDNDGAKITFGASGTATTNGLDVTFFGPSGVHGISWDAGNATMSTSASGGSFVAVGTSGAFEHALRIPIFAVAPTTSVANASGAIVFDVNASAIGIYTGSSWVYTAALTS